MLNIDEAESEDKAPNGLTEIIACLNRIAFALEEIANKGIPVQQTSAKCQTGNHEWCEEDQEPYGREATWWACGCLCHN